MLIAAAAAVQAAASGTAFAQNAVTPAPASNSTEIGPRQLRDFTLNGTVTRPAQTQVPAPARTAPAPAAPAPRAQPQPSSTTALPPPRVPARTAPAPAPAPGGMTVELPPPSPTAALPPTAGAPMELPPAPDTAATFAPEPSGSIPDSPSLLPWLLVAALLGGGAAFYFFRPRPRSQLAGGPQVSEFVAPEPTPPQPAPAPRPRAVPPAGGGVVSTGLRPWIEIDFVPERTIVDEQNVAIEFLVTLYNSGGAPARDVLIETAMFNASRTQDQQIGAFFATPAGRGHRVPVVAPLQRVAARSAVTMPRSEIQPLYAEGRPLLVPLVALNALYRWGTNNHGQTSASYLAGKETKTDKLAPFRLDVGPRVFRGLAAREHELKVRN